MSRLLLVLALLGQVVGVTPTPPLAPVSCGETAVMILDQGVINLNGGGQATVFAADLDDGSFLTPSFGPVVWWRIEVMDGDTPIKSDTGAAPSVLLECAEHDNSPNTIRITGWGYDLDAQPEYEVCGVSDTTTVSVGDPTFFCP